MLVRGLRDSLDMVKANKSRAKADPWVFPDDRNLGALGETRIPQLRRKAAHIMTKEAIINMLNGVDPFTKAARTKNNFPVKHYNFH
mgnify:CR=1 FL=1